MGDEDTKAADGGDSSATENKPGLEAMVESPKGAGGVPPVDDKSKQGEGAEDSPTSSSSTGRPSPEEALEIAARAERKAQLDSEAAAKREKEANDRLTAAETKEKAADAKLQEAAELMLAREDLSKGQKIAALKKFLGKAYDPADLIQALSLDIPVTDDDGKPKVEEKPLAEQVDELIEAREKKKADKEEEDRKAAEAKKAEDDKKEAAENTKRQVEAWRVQATESFDKEKHPNLAEKIERWTEDFGEEQAKRLVQDLALKSFFRVAKEYNEDGTPRDPNEVNKKPRTLDPDEAITMAEMELAARRKPVKTVADELEEELAAIDKRTSDSTGPFRRETAVETKPRRREEMTIMEQAEAEADEWDKRAGRESLY